MYAIASDGFFGLSLSFGGGLGCGLTTGGGGFGGFLPPSFCANAPTDRPTTIAKVNNIFFIDLITLISPFLFDLTHPGKEGKCVHSYLEQSRCQRRSYDALVNDLVVIFLILIRSVSPKLTISAIFIRNREDCKPKRSTFN